MLGVFVFYYDFFFAIRIKFYNSFAGDRRITGELESCRFGWKDIRTALAGAVPGVLNNIIVFHFDSFLSISRNIARSLSASSLSIPAITDPTVSGKSSTP